MFEAAEYFKYYAQKAIVQLEELESPNLSKQARLFNEQILHLGCQIHTFTLERQDFQRIIDDLRKESISQQDLLVFQKKQLAEAEKQHRADVAQKEAEVQTLHVQLNQLGASLKQAAQEWDAKLQAERLATSQKQLEANEAQMKQLSRTRQEKDEAV